jgi:mannosylglycoprotein endo-beta-mannosidase
MTIPTESICPEITKPHLLNSTNNNWVVVKDKIVKTPLGDQDLPTITNQGIAYSTHGIGAESSIPAIVPGTILNTLLRDRDWLKEHIRTQYIDEKHCIHSFKERAESIDTDFFDPFFDINQKFIPDASIDGGVELYTYWYYTEFTLATSAANQRFWLNLRGINYTADVFLNGVQLNKEEQLQGMFLRHSFDITDHPSKDGVYRLAIRIVPPDSPGIPTTRNGGAAGKPNIGEHVTMRHTVGWDWTISIPDRSTGLWDQVSVSTTKAFQLKHPKVTTKVKGSTAVVTIHAEVQNSSSIDQTGFVSYELEGNTHQQSVVVAAGATIPVAFDPFEIENARLWWPNGADPKNPKYKPELYTLNLYAAATAEINADSLSDQKILRVGMREFTHAMVPLDNPQKRQFSVNGVPIFIRGGNWMGMDTLFRGDATRYRNEVRMHKEMNLNMIRVWGGGIIERPEFYEACDEMGIMVMQEFWFSSEFKFFDPNAYPPDDKASELKMLMPKSYVKIFTKCAQDTIQMLRNHTSLLFWCAANESEPPTLLLTKLQGYIGEGDKALDDRLLVKNSLMIHGDSKGTDGPYGILELNNYFQQMPNCWTNPFNPEIGSLGIPPVESIRRTIRATNLTEPPKKFAQFEMPTQHYDTHKDLPVVNESWNQLKYSQYFVDYNVGDQTEDFEDQLYTYGVPKDIDAFCDQAQLTNYMQYKGLWEGYLTHMWDWYTGLIIWKSQGSWTGVRAKLYDWFLEQNGGHWGVKDACEAIHVQLNFINYPKGTLYEINVVNHTPQEVGNLKLNWNVYDMKGSIYSKPIPSDGTIVIPKSSTTKIGDLNLTKILSKLASDVYFVVLELEQEDKTLSRNMYWLSKTGHYEEIGNYSTPVLTASAKGSKDVNGNYVLQTSFANNAAQLSFWNRVQVRKPSKSGEIEERILPVFYEHNYFSLMIKEKQSNQIEFQYDGKEGAPELWLKGWNQKWLQVYISWEK